MLLSSHPCWQWLWKESQTKKFKNYFSFGPIRMFSAYTCFCELTRKEAHFHTHEHPLPPCHRAKELNLHFRDFGLSITDRHNRILARVAPLKNVWPGPVYNRKVSSESTVRKVAEADFPTRWGQFRIFGFEGHVGDDRRVETAVALVMGDIHSAPPLVQ